MRTYYAEERVFSDCGKEINIGQLHTECRAIRDRLPDEVPDEETGERGGFVVVLKDLP